MPIIDSGETFSLQYVTVDRKRKTGGKFIDLTEARVNKSSIVSGQSQTKTTGNKSPNQYENATRNLVLPNGQIRKCHIRLITMFNGQPVTY